jgi:hypothetical protein
MYQPSSDRIVDLLQKINATEVETFKNFPEVIRAGAQLLEKDEVDYLSASGYLEVKKTDSFGKFLQLSEKARQLIGRDDS